LLSNLLAADTIGENEFVSLDGLFSSNRPIFDSITGLSSSDMTDEEIDLLRPDYYRRQTAATNRQLFVKVHEGYYRNADGEPILPADCSNGAIYLVRHPYDVAVSYAHHQGHDNFDLIIDQMNAADHALSSLGGMQLRQRTLGWQGHFRSWQDQEAIPVITIRYEDMLADTAASLHRMATFLDLSEKDDRPAILRAVEASRFEHLRNKEERVGFRERHAKSKNFFRAGTSGDGMRVLTAAQRERIYDCNGTLMDALGYLP
jgi:hypothetical protein